MGARYLRTLGKPVLNMSGRFHKSWGDFGGIRTEPSLEYDLVYGLANAMRANIGDHFHPRGDINKPVFALYKRLYDGLRPLEDWIEGATAEVDTAVVWQAPYPGYKFMSPSKRVFWDKQYNAIKGATRLLCELKYQFDIVTDFVDWDKYELLVLPDHISLNDEWAGRVRKHLDRGGALLSSAWSGLDPEGKGFVFDDWGARFVGEDPYDPDQRPPLARRRDRPARDGAGRRRRRGPRRGPRAGAGHRSRARGPRPCPFGPPPARRLRLRRRPLRSQACLAQRSGARRSPAGHR